MLQMTRAGPPTDAAPRHAAPLAPLLAGVLLAALPPAALGAPPAGPRATTPAASAAPPGEAPAATAADANSPLATTPAATEASPETRGLDQEIQDLKKDVVDLNKDLFILEEELLFPANTQVAVFLSLDVGQFFALDSVQLKLDRKEVINYLYTPREVDALLKGGVQRLYLGNLKVGAHELVAFFNGKGPNERAYKRGASLRFEKGVGAKYL